MRIRTVLTGLCAAAMLAGCRGREPQVEGGKPPQAEVARPAPETRPEKIPEKPFSMLKADGDRIVDEAGDAFILKGCNLDGWLSPIPAIPGMPNHAVPMSREAAIRKQLGAETDKLMDAYRQGFITAKDMEIIKATGFNAVRLPVHYALLEDAARPMSLSTNAFVWVDEAVRMAEAAKLYVILNLRFLQTAAPPGPPGTPAPPPPWPTERVQQTAQSLWKEVAARFKDSKVIAAYDLTLEPFGSRPAVPPPGEELALAEKLYQAVRSADPAHLIFLPALRDGLAAYGKPSDRGWANAGFAEQIHPAALGDVPSLEDHARFLGRRVPARAKLLEKAAAPFLVSGFNPAYARVAAPAMIRKYFDEFARRGWAACLWNYKLPLHAGAGSADTWALVASEEPIPEINLESATPEEIQTHLASLNDRTYKVSEALRAALTSKTPPSIALAGFKPLPEDIPGDELPGEWKAENVGAATAGGQRVHAPDAMDIVAAGVGIDGTSTSDQFRYVWRKVKGDFDFSAKILGLADSDPAAKAGIMVRGSLQPDSAHLMLHALPDEQVGVVWRQKDASPSLEQEVQVSLFPLYMRVQRHGNIVKVSSSHDGRSWLATRNFECSWLGDECYVGLAVASRDPDGALTTASFQELSMKMAKAGE
jgi:hypothetical protein